MNSSNVAGPDVAVVEQQVFRDVISRFASGVTVITTSVDGARHGTTASAFTSLSLDPPMVLVCLNKTSSTQAAVLDSGAFCVNILAEGQGDLAYQFAKKGDKFANVTCGEGLNGVPVLSDTHAHLECLVHEVVTGGTHTVFMGRVVVAEGHEGAPLTYYRGRFGRLESVREEAAYEAVRGWLLTRQVQPNQPLELAELTQELGLELPHVAYALMRLTTEYLVTRTADGRYVATPVTVELADDLFVARGTIEIGVAESRIGRIPPEDLAAMEDKVTRMKEIIEQDDPSLDEFLDLSHDYHAYFVGLSKSPALADMYSRLGIAALWRRAMAGHDWWNVFRVDHAAELTKACRNGDIPRARQLILDHTDRQKTLVRGLVRRAGGAL